MGKCYPNLYLVPCGKLNFISLATPDQPDLLILKSLIYSKNT